MLHTYRKQLKYGFLFAASLLGGCKTLEQVNGDLAALNAALDRANSPSTRSASQQGGFVRTNNQVGLQMTDAQIANLDKQLDTRAQESPAITKARAQSRELVKYVTMRTACATTTFQIDIRYADGPVFLYAARGQSSTAPKNLCYSVVRLTSWKMPTQNTLQFCADYGSEISGEGNRRCVELITNDGENWLVRGDFIA